MSNKSILIRIRPKNSKYVLEITSPECQFLYQDDLDITREKHEAQNQSLRERLSDRVDRISNSLNLSKHEMQSALRKFAREGYFLFRELFPPESKARECITSLLQREDVRVIKIYARSFSLPWEILCSSHPQKTTSGEWECPTLWGERYVIQRHFPLNRPSDSLRQSKRQISRPKIALAVLRDLPYVKEEIDYLEQLHKCNKIELDTLKRLKPSLQEDEMEAVEKFFKKKRDIAHFACHLRLNQSADSSSLIVSDQFELSPHLLTSHGVSIAGKPLFVLNACDSGIHNPLQMSGFISFILNYADSIGVVATECKVPSQFATAFAKQFYDRFLIQNMSIGQALVKTRQAFMEPKYYNPLGLLYSLYQVDPDFHLTKVPNPRLRRTS